MFAEYENLLGMPRHKLNEARAGASRSDCLGCITFKRITATLLDNQFQSLPLSQRYQRHPTTKFTRLELRTTTTMNHLPQAWGRPRDDVYGAYDHSYLQQSGPTQHTQQPVVTGTSVLGLKFKDGVVIASDNLGRL